MKDILTAPFVEKMKQTTANMYRLGWDERNGGNISCLLREEEVAEYLDTGKVLRTIPTGFDAKPLTGQYFIVTGTGKYFKNVEKDPETNLGIIRIAADGTTAELLWGYKDGGRFTSELPAHLMSHMARLEVDPENRVVMHSHPTYTLAMNYVHELDEKKLTHTLWEMCTECIVVFPDGVGVLPWMLCGTNSIGEATAAKMKEFRLVIWGMHGIYGAGKTLDETFGLIESGGEGRPDLYAHGPPAPGEHHPGQRDAGSWPSSSGSTTARTFWICKARRRASRTETVPGSFLAKSVL